MQFLSQALRKHYSKKVGKILFFNDLSLNNLAFQMWEELGNEQIDASVLSKVINGKRLFTPKQLEVFCNILNIENEDKNYLFFCLNKDYCIRNKIDIDKFFVSKDSVLDIFDVILKQIFIADFKCNKYEVIKLVNTLELFIKDLANTPLFLNQQLKINQIISYSLFFKSKQILNFKHGSLYIEENSKLRRIYASTPVLNKVSPRENGVTIGVYKNNIPNICSAKYIVKIHPELNKLKIGSDLVIPVKINNSTVSILSFLSNSSDVFTKNDIETVQSLSII